MDEHRSLVYKSQMQNGLFITSVFFVFFFLIFQDLLISKSGFLTMNLVFCYQKVQRCISRTFSAVAVASAAILSAILCNRCAFKSICTSLLNSLTPST